MPPFDDFIYVSTGPGSPPPNGATELNWPGGTSVPQDYFDHSRGLRHNTEALVVESIRKNHPDYHLTVTPPNNYIGLANSRDDITCTPSTASPQKLIERYFLPPARRFGDEKGGTFASNVVFGCFDYEFQGTKFLLYVIVGTVGSYDTSYNYILTPIELPSTEDSLAIAQKKADGLIAAAVTWGEELHREVLVFDQGFWQKSSELYENIQKSNWEDVILAKERKEAIITDVIGFFNSAERYAEFGVPWKRGVIFYGPPGNGKTISTKALMHDVSKRTSPQVNSLYVKTFNTWQGPEYGIRLIFERARQMAPCLLIFEDIDSLVGPGVRSYFLNEVDGLESNQGILMIGSTNHLERLDPGIAKRPSRFDRKYFFDVPDEGERVQYAEYWRHKLRNNKKVDFPEILCQKIAGITAEFSFAYMKEAFVAALLVIAGSGDQEEEERGSPGSDGDNDGLKDNVFWQELQKQVTNLRNEMEHEEGGDSVNGGLLSHLRISPETTGGSSGRFPMRGGPPRGREQQRRPGEGPFKPNHHPPRLFRHANQGAQFQ